MSQVLICCRYRLFHQ